MPILRLDRQYRNLQRYRQIIGVLIKYGFGHIIERLNIVYYLELGRRVVQPKRKRREIVHLTFPERMRLVCEELGPTFIKLGQILSTKPDLVGPEYIEELQKLQDEVTPVEFSKIKNQVENELKAPLDILFHEFSEQPSASASIAQVHHAITVNNEKVVVKVQRPGVEKTVKADLSILLHLATLLERRIPETKTYDLTGIVNEFAKTIKRELDFFNEARNIDRFSRNFADDNTIYVPKIYWDLTTSKILTLERIDGIKISDIEGLERAGLNRKLIALRGAEVCLKQVLVHGFFHADPHPGNVFIIEDNVMVPLDFGMMGRLDKETIDELTDLLIAMVRKDSNKIINVFSNIGIIDERVNLRKLKSDISEFIDRYYEVPLNQINMKLVIDEIMSVIRQHRLRLPSNLLLLTKTLTTVESVGRNLDPEFDLIAVAKPYGAQLIRRRLSFTYMARDLKRELEDIIELIRIFPREVERIIKKVASGELKIEFEHRGLDEFIYEIDRSFNRVAFSFVVAALVVGSALILQSDKGPQVFGMSVLGILGFLLSGLLGLWLVISIIRAGRL